MRTHEDNKRLKEVRAKNIQRLKELENRSYKDTLEWEEYHLLKSKYKGVHLK
jgi:hypothetical protein